MSVEQPGLSGLIHTVGEGLEGRVSNRHLALFGVGFVGLFFILPVLLLVPESLHLDSATPFESYRRVMDGIYVDAFVRSFLFGVVTTAVTLALAYLLSYYLAFVTDRVRIAMTLIIVPLWIAYIVRYFGILLFLSPAGPFADLTGVEPGLLFTTPAVIIGLANVYLPFAVLPLYNSLNAIDEELIDASRVLGADKWRTITKVIFPLSLPGLVAAGLIVFILAAGSFLGPAVLGGPRQTMIANVIAQAFLDNFNIQFASALAIVYTVLLVALLFVFNAVFSLQEVLEKI
ncbi:ABC transporter permease [Haloarcula nitratireducens]|uniref:ABC transporter permease n=1 Tax=Haloarcula nitratireducens TaxID=2487749 RepID=A0AAW4PEI2_9EURY|nr:ABC transporter permease [Halomicroarcula nitratireducens]MBX0296234.1 ABC transporter permease [Halomicroarcula nitratireducens]